MAPSKWDDEDSESTPPSSPPPATTAIPRRGGKFADEEDDSDVLESWDAEEDSEVEREKAKKAAEAQAAATAKAQQNKKSKSQRIEEHRMAKMRQRQKEEEDDSEEEEEDEEAVRQRMRRMEKEADLKNAEDLFGGAGTGPKERGAKAVTTTDPKDPSKTIDLSSLSIFAPTSRDQFTSLRETIAPLLAANSKKAQYTVFVTDLTKQICGDLSSDAIKKVASSLTALSNERMKEEKAADKGAKKSKAAKTKTTLNANRDVSRGVDTAAYDDGLDDDDFM